MARRVSLFLLVGLVDPYAGNLAQPAADADVDGNCQARRRRAEHVGRQPAQQRRDARKRAGHGNDEAGVAGVVGRWRHRGGDDEADGADER